MIYACHAIILVKVLKINQQNKGACTVNQKKKYLTVKNQYMID